MKKKIIAIALCAALAVGGAVAGSLAFFTDTDEVTNTFTVGDVKLTLDEKKVNTDGTPDTTTSGRAQENVYHLLPGHEYIKDPIVHITAESEDCYAYVAINNEIAGAECAGNGSCVTHTGCSTIAEQMEANGWYSLNGKKITIKNDAGVDKTYDVYVYGTKSGDVVTPTIVAKDAADKDLEVFEKFWISEALLAQNGNSSNTGEDYLSHWNNKTVNVKAFAVQADGFTENNQATLAYAEKAWNATFGK